MVQEAINKKTMNRHSQLDAIYRQTNKLKITLQMEYIIILLCLVYVVWFWKTLYRFNKETKTYEKCKLELWVLGGDGDAILYPIIEYRNGAYDCPYLNGQN